MCPTAKRVLGPIHTMILTTEINMSTYTYSSLKNSQIRLIKLYPLLAADGPRDKRAKVLSATRIDVQHVPLEEAPPFVAISYTWGSSSQNAELFIGRDKLLVSQNAFNILQRLRPEADDTDEYHYFWMDQISINQGDADEKLQQIRMMRDIFDKALATFVFLADISATSDPVLQQLGMLDLEPLLSRPGPFVSVNEGSFLRGWSSNEIPELVERLFVYPMFREHFETLLKNPVFTRAWIYQEIVTSHRVFLLGHQIRIDWDIFSRAFELYTRLSAANPDGSPQLSAFQSLDLIIGDRIIYQAGKHKDWMLLHVEAQGLLGALDPRDNTIALTTFEDFYAKIPAYGHITVATLYTTTAKSMIHASKSLAIFSALSGTKHLEQRELENMPSWVPDWSTKRQSIPLYWPQTGTAFDAAKGFSHTPTDEPRELRLNKRVLVVRGKKIDTVALMSAHRFEDYEHHESLADMLEVQRHGAEWLAHAESRGYPLINGARTFQNCRPFGRAMIAAMTASFGSYSSFTSDHFQSIPPDQLYDELQFILAYYDEIMDGKALYHEQKPHFLSTLTSTYGSWKAAATKLRQWCSVCFGRRIAYGETENFGLLPKSAECGDVVCVLHGSKTPVILRQLEGCYRVIGQCYWHKWMYGDLVDWKEENADSFHLI